MEIHLKNEAKKMRPPYDNKRIRTKTITALTPERLDKDVNEFRKIYTVISETPTPIIRSDDTILWVATIFYEEQ